VVAAAYIDLTDKNDRCRRQQDQRLATATGDLLRTGETRTRNDAVVRHLSFR
jgi:hypothetical protein